MSDLPKGWTQVAFSDVLEVNPRRSFDLEPGDAVTFVPMAAVSEISGAIINGVSRPLREVVRGFTQFADGDVIFAKITPSMENGKAAITRDLRNGIGFGSTEFHVLRSYGGVTPEYIWYFIRQASFRDHARKVMTGAVGQQRVPADYLKAHPLPLPPLAEQRRIVTRLNSLISRTAFARETLDHIPALIERYKSCSLEKAFSDWIKSFSSADQNISRQEDKICVGELVEKIVSGKNLRCEERPPSLDEKGVVKVSAVTWGKFDPLASKTLPPTFEPPDKSRIQNGDLLISRANTLELLGAVVIVDGCPENLYLSDKVLRLEMPEDDKRWLMWFLRSPKGRKEIEVRASGNQVSMRNISQKKLREIPLPWPAPNVRREIVRRIETAFAWLDRVSDEHAATLRRLPLLDTSILQAAFRGELVPQKPHDEPASRLLERIAAENEQKQVKRKTARKVASRSKKPTKRGANMADLIEVLKSKADWISASNAAQVLGIGDGATSDAVEEFYNELRLHFQNGDVEVERRGDEDWLRLMPISEE